MAITLACQVSDGSSILLSRSQLQWLIEDIFYMEHIKLFEQFLAETVKFDLKSTGRDDWDSELKKHSGDFNQEIVYMSPDEFLKRVRFDRFTVDSGKVNSYLGSFKKGATMPTPTMWFQDQFQYEKGLAPSWHDGSHRVLALKELGVKKIPIKIIF